MSSIERLPVEPTPSVSRRQALKQGAVAGGALLWVTPAMQAISIDAAHAQTGSSASTAPALPDDPPRPPPAVGFPSSIQLAAKRSGDGTVFGLSFDGRSWGAIASGDSCFASALAYSGPDSAASAAFSGSAVTKDLSSGTYRFSLPGGYTMVAGQARCGGVCRPARQSGSEVTFGCS